MIKKMSIGLVVITFLVIFTTMFFQYELGGQVLQEKLKHLRGVGILMRGALFVLTFSYWDHIIQWFGRKQEWEAEHLEYVLSRRWKVAVYMVLVELFIVQNIIPKTIEFIGL